MTGPPCKGFSWLQAFCNTEPVFASWASIQARLPSLPWFPKASCVPKPSPLPRGTNGLSPLLRPCVRGRVLASYHHSCVLVCYSSFLFSHKVLIIEVGTWKSKRVWCSDWYYLLVVLSDFHWTVIMLIQQSSLYVNSLMLLALSTMSRPRQRREPLWGIEPDLPGSFLAVPYLLCNLGKFSLLLCAFSPQHV